MSTILIVDDSQENLCVLSRLLTDLGYQVRAAINGRVALKTIEKSPPDLILLDILMPELDGFEVCRRLHAQQHTRDIPIIFLSALDAASEKIQAFSIGGVDYITKPFHPEEVAARVKTHLALHHVREELQEKNAELCAALDNVSALNGLLPICAACKKIRDDRGYWSQLEQYIERHSEVLFTHGLCPDCLEKYYAEINNNRNNRNTANGLTAVNTLSEQQNVLIVDDTPANLTTLTKILSQKTYQIRPAINGQVALKTVRVVPPDLILLDIMLPDMDGYSLCRQFKADSATRDIPVIFISALDSTADKLKAFRAGGVDYITKPFQPEEVLARVDAHINTRKMQQALQQQNLKLQHEIYERIHAEETLQKQNQELAVLYRMSHTLQKCRTEQDTYHVVAGICQQVLPGSSGCLYIRNSAQEKFFSGMSWGDTPQISENFSLEEIEQCYKRSSFFHVHVCPQTHAVSIPIMSGEEILAALSFSFDPDASLQSADEWRQLITAQEMVLSSLVEYYALSLVNLRLRETLRLEAIHDPLTGLYNRRYMLETLKRELGLSRRKKSALSLVMLDIDYFKDFNDTYGHAIGDIVLQEVGRSLQSAFRCNDIVCRYGGEEFLIILPGASLMDAYRRADAAREQIQALVIPYQQTTLHITLSAGVAIFPERDAHIEDVIHAADQALYQAKKRGRNQVAGV